MNLYKIAYREDSVSMPIVVLVVSETIENAIDYMVPRIAHGVITKAELHSDAPIYIDS